MRAIKCKLILHGKYREIQGGLFDSITAAKKWIAKCWDKPYTIIRVEYGGLRDTPQYPEVHKQYIEGQKSIKIIHGKNTVGITSHINNCWYAVIPESIIRLNK